MSEQKIQLASLLLLICLIFPQSNAKQCIFEGQCVTVEDCNNICKSGEDPFLCIRSGPNRGKCCCLKKDGFVIE
ncbi:PREDICTED: putative defensin-like protein 277 [Camelina sativa]|uniref:Defensin-like protein 277 n=1 Tax=Camelina sativa TaxID=90675 RepID=A0ABM1QN14_CAMSA|nr:PREDICTED: putative defensin-like protein 277 [Camelina sativa]